MKKLMLVLVLLGGPSWTYAQCLESSSGEDLLRTAVTNLESFSYIRKAMSSVKSESPQGHFCTSAVALGKDMYQNMRYYIQRDAFDANGRLMYRFHFLHQDASVQAVHNVGQKPWVALSDIGTQNFWERTFNSVQWTAAKTCFDAVQAAKTSALYLSSAADVDEKTLTIAELGEHRSRRIKAVSWLIRPKEGVYAGFPSPKVVLVSQDPSTGDCEIAENLWVTANIENPLTELLNEEREKMLPAPDWTSLLLQVSKTQSN